MERKYVIHDDSPPPVTASIRALDVDSLLQLAGPDWTGDAALFAFRSQELKVLTRGSELPLTLERLQYELFTITPIQVKNDQSLRTSFHYKLHTCSGGNDSHPVVGCRVLDLEWPLPPSDW